MQFGLNKPTIPVSKAKKLPFVKANSKKEVPKNRQNKVDKKDEKLDKLPLSKSKTFKAKNNKKMNISEKASPVREKEDLTNKPEVKTKQVNPPIKKQVNYNTKIPNENRQNKAASRYMAQKEKIILHLEDESEDIQKSNSSYQQKTASTTRASKLSNFPSKGGRTSFGILSQKNEMDQINVSNKKEIPSSRYNDNDVPK